jgi:hypothetical protein
MKTRLKPAKGNRRASAGTPGLAGATIEMAYEPSATEVDQGIGTGRGRYGELGIPTVYYEEAVEVVEPAG